MNHGDHSGHGGMDMGPKCAMNMLWNTQIIDTCIVFPQWHIASNFSFVLSIFVIVGLGVAYEWLRCFQTRVDLDIARSLRARMSQTSGGAVSVASTSPVLDEEVSLLTEQPVKGRKTTAVPFLPRIYRAIIYGAAIFLSFFLMLVFMTYNAYLILAVVVGAALGHFVFGGEMNPDTVLSAGTDGKGMACH